MTGKESGSSAGYRDAVNPGRYEVAEALEWPLSYAHAAGDLLTAGDGRQFLDLVAEYGAATLGHRHPRLVSALTAALADGPPFVVPIGLPDLAGDLARRLCRVAGGRLERAYFCTGGAEAVECAMKFAMAATGKTEFVSFDGAFHGLTPGALSLAGADYWRRPLPRGQGAGRRRVPFGDVAAVEAILQSHPVAAVVVECIQGLAGVRPWPPQALRDLARCCAAHGTLLIADEVLTGIGRTGDWFAFQQAGLEPDLVVVSKGLTGGIVPVAAVLMRRDVHESVYRSLEDANVHSSTFEGHLLGMVAGLTVLDVIEEEGLVARAASVGARLLAALRDVQAESIGLTGVRGRGLMAAFQVAGLETPDGPDGAAACMELLIGRGIMVYPAAHDPAWLKLTPPLTVGAGSLDRFTGALRECLRELAQSRPDAQAPAPSGLRSLGEARQP